MSIVCNGKQAGRVVMCKLSQDMRRLDGIWIDAGLRGVRLIDAERICVIGERAIIVDGMGERVRMKPETLFARAISTTGKRLGAIVDVELDELSLCLRAVILSRGMIEDFTRGEVRYEDFSYDAQNRRVVIPENNSMEVGI
jgi:uncharacterized protein YrrD